jgi:hypothetical protein
MADQQIEFSLFDYFDNTQEGVAEMVAVLNEAPVSAPGAGRKSYAYDCGEELKGARKHLAALTKFSQEWYEALEQDPTQAFEAICKDELLGDFRPDGLREIGFSSEVAYAIKLIWDRVSQRPADDPKQREYYVQGINELQLVFAEAHTETLFREAFGKLKEDVWKGYYSQYERKLKEDPSLVNYVFWFSLGDRFKSIFSSFGRGREAGCIKIFAKAFLSDEGKDWKWNEGKARNSVQKDNVNRWERLVPVKVERLSQEPSGVEKPDDLMEHYGYRGIQFGNWVEDAAGRYHVLCSGNAHADLATILNLPRASISFHGALGLAFGSRGSGRASAHYEPHLNIIALTKINGGGALAHEWAHALDYNLNSFSHDFSNGKQAPLSGSKTGGRLPYSIQSAFTRLMEKIKQGNGLLRFEVPEELPRTRSNYITAVRRSLERNDYDVTKALAGLKGSYSIKGKTWEDIGITYCHMLKEAGKEVPKEFFIPTDFSSFFLDAKERGPYWRRDHELFARAFEAWIEDELFERGMINTYLVSGTRYGGPYPQGDERAAINEAFRAWWSVLLDSGILQDEQIWHRA